MLPAKLRASDCVANSTVQHNLYRRAWNRVLAKILLYFTCTEDDTKSPERAPNL